MESGGMEIRVRRLIRASNGDDYVVAELSASLDKEDDPDKIISDMHRMLREVDSMETDLEQLRSEVSRTKTVLCRMRAELSDTLAALDQCDGIREVAAEHGIEFPALPTADPVPF